MSFWMRFGLVLGAFWDPFWSPNRIKLGQKFILKRSLFKKANVHETLEKSKARATFLTPRWAQDGLKTGPRRVQER